VKNEHIKKERREAERPRNDAKDKHKGKTGTVKKKKKGRKGNLRIYPELGWGGEI